MDEEELRKQLLLQQLARTPAEKDAEKHAKLAAAMARINGSSDTAVSATATKGSPEAAPPLTDLNNMSAAAVQARKVLAEREREKERQAAQAKKAGDIDVHLYILTELKKGLTGQPMDLYNPPLIGGRHFIPPPPVNPHLTRNQRRIFVGNLPGTGFGITDRLLMDYMNLACCAAGIGLDTGSPVIKCDVANSGLHAFLEFHSVDEATEALCLDGILFMDRALQVQRPQRGDMTSRMREIYGDGDWPKPGDANYNAHLHAM